MPPPKNKQKGKHKGKGKNKGKHGHQHKKGASQQKKKDTSKHTNHASGKKGNLFEKQQEKLLHRKMIENIDAMYSEYTKKNESMRTFFGIFTKHNQLQLRELMKAAIPNINEIITDKILKSTQHDAKRDINQFIFLGDVVIGAFATELINNEKDCLVRAFCILPYFQNYGFGSRLMVHLVKNAVKRKKLNTISLFIHEDNKKGLAFFQRFGFKMMKQKENVSENKNTKKSEQKQDTNMVEKVKMRLDLRIFRSSIMVLVKKELKKEQQSKRP